MNEGAPAAPERPSAGTRAWLVALGLAMALAGLLIAAVFVTAVIQVGRSSSSGVSAAAESWTLAVIATIGFVPLVGGLALAYGGDRHFHRRLAAGVIEIGRAGWANRGTLALSSPGLAALTFLAWLPFLLAGEAPAVVASLTGLCAFAIADPALLLRRRSWWLGVLFSLPSWLVLFTAMAGITEARFRLREGGMVYLLPFMIYPAALALSGVVTLVRWSWRRLGDDQGATATTRADQGQ